MMLKSKIIGIFVAALAGLAICGNDMVGVVKGNGVVKEKIQQCGNLKEVKVGGVWQLRIISGAEENKIRLSVEENILELVKLDIVDNRLTVKTQGSINPTKPMIIEVYQQKLPETLTAGGTCKVKIEKSNAEKLECNISGAVQLDIDESKFNVLKLNLNGACKAKVEAACNVATIDIHGSSKLDFDGSIERLNLAMAGATKVDIKQVDDAEIKVSGASKLEIEKAGTLKGQLNGASSLKYKKVEKIDVKATKASRIDGPAPDKN